MKLPEQDAILFFDLMFALQLYVKGQRQLRFGTPGEIIVSFDTAVQTQSAAKAKKALKDWQPTIASLNEQAQTLRAQPGSPPSWGRRLAW